MFRVLESTLEDAITLLSCFLSLQNIHYLSRFTWLQTGKAVDVGISPKYDTYNTSVGKGSSHQGRQDKELTLSA